MARSIGGGLLCNCIRLFYSRGEEQTAGMDEVDTRKTAEDVKELHYAISAVAELLLDIYLGQKQARSNRETSTLVLTE